MSLAWRLSAFFLASLAVVLVGFSATLFGLASIHLRRQVDEKLDSALATLAAAAEIDPRGVEWEPRERLLGLGVDRGPDQIRWVIRDDRGAIVDRSANLDERRLPLSEARIDDRGGRILGRDGRPWRSKALRLDSHRRPGPNRDRRGGRRDHDALTFVAFAPLGPTEATLRRLTGTLAILSVAVWGIAAVVGRRLCEAALRPLIAMASASREIGVDDPSSRLPVPETGDELENLALAFNGLLDRLNEALVRQRRFSGDASHQLRTPLAALLSQIDVALRRERPSEEYRRVLATIRGRAAELRQIVESLLFLARAESDAGRPGLEVVDLAAWLSETLDRWRKENPARSGDLGYDCSWDVPCLVTIHPSLMAQVLDNLLDNAGKYSESGTPIVVSLAGEAANVVLSVEDRGCGVPAEDLPRIFEPFYRSREAILRGDVGVGLGLSVARRIILAFGGEIRAASRPDGGTRFEVVLRAVDGRSGSEMQPMSP